MFLSPWPHITVDAYIRSAQLRYLYRRLQMKHFFFHGTTAASGPGPPHYRSFTITLIHTTIGRAPLDEGSARFKDLSLTTHNTDKTQTSMPLAGIEPTIPEN